MFDCFKKMFNPEKKVNDPWTKLIQRNSFQNNFNEILFNLSSTFVITILDLFLLIFKVLCNSSAFLGLTPVSNFFRLDINENCLSSLDFIT